MDLCARSPCARIKRARTLNDATTYYSTSTMYLRQRGYRSRQRPCASSGSMTARSSTTAWTALVGTGDVHPVGPPMPGSTSFTSSGHPRGRISDSVCRRRRELSQVRCRPDSPSRCSGVFTSEQTDGAFEHLGRRQPAGSSERTGRGDIDDTVGDIDVGNQFRRA